jgi:hypothetical protein
MLVLKTRVQMNFMKVEAINNWPQPIDGKKMQRFMGAANFHREFSHEFARIAAPLNECRNDKKIDWTAEKIKAFKELKILFLRSIEL